MSFVNQIDGWTRTLASMRGPTKATASPAARKPSAVHQHVDVPVEKKRGQVSGFDTVNHEVLAKFVAVKACERAGRSSNAAVLKAAYDAALIMIEEHGAFDGPQAEISIVDQTACDIEAIREDPKGYEYWVNGAIQILSEFATALPANIGQDSLGMTAEALGLIKNSRDFLGKVVLLLSAKTGPASVAMRPWSKAIAANLKTVKGARLGRGARDVFPDERRSKMTAYDLAHDVFRDTPFLAALSVHVPVPIPKRVRTEHTNIVKPSGGGKTQLLQLWLTHDLKDVADGKASVVLFDTDGTLSHKVMRLAAGNPALAERVVYIDPAIPDLRPDVNLLDLGPKGGGTELANYVLEAFGEGFTDRQKNFFGKVTSAISRIPNANLNTLISFLSEEDYAQRYLCEFPSNIASFVSERMFNGQYASTREQVADRISSLKDIDAISGIFDADKTDLDIAGAINRGALVIIRINKSSTADGGLGIYAKVVCRFYLASVVTAVQSRLAYEDNMLTWLYLDEIADMIGGGSDHFITEFLIQARKKGAGAILAYQVLSQLTGVLRAIALGNTSIKIAGKVDASDRESLSGNMDCPSSLFGQALKTETYGQVACVIQGVLNQAAICRFPFGVLESLPKGSKRQLDDLFDQQRAFWAAPRAARMTANPAKLVRPVYKGESVIQMEPIRKDRRGFD